MNSNNATTLLLGVILFSIFGTIFIGIWFIRYIRSSQKKERLSRYVARTVAEEPHALQKEKKETLNGNLSSLREWIDNSLGIFSSKKLEFKISSAYWAITATEFILITTVSAAMTFLLGWYITGRIVGGLLLFVLTVITPRFLLDMSITRRQKQFQTQLLDVLVLIKGAVIAGYGFLQALDLAIKEISDPAAEEFGRVMREMNLGLTLEDALTNLVQRMENDDLHIVATAIIINSQIGGTLSTVLEASIDTIRARMQLMGEIRSLTSYSRYVGYLLTLLPFITAALVFMVSPDYFDTLWTSLITQIVFGMAFLGIIVGNIWIRRIVKIKV